MKPYVKVFLDSRMICGYDPWVCELCGTPFTEVRLMGPPHHIRRRGMGGNKALDVKENLIGLCSTCHTRADANLIPEAELLERVAGILKQIGRI